MAHSNELECADADELFSMEVEDLFDDNNVNVACNKTKIYCEHCQHLVSKSTYYRHKILYYGDDSSDSSTDHEINEIFYVNNDNDSEGLSRGNSFELGSLSFDVTSDVTESPRVQVEGNAASTQAPESVRKIKLIIAYCMASQHMYQTKIVNNKRPPYRHLY